MFQATKEINLQDGRPESQKILYVWENIGEFYKTKQQENIDIEQRELTDVDDKWPSILQSDVIRAISDIKRKKAIGDVTY